MADLLRAAVRAPLRALRTLGARDVPDGGKGQVRTDPAHVVRSGGRLYRLGFLLGTRKSGTNWAGSLLNLHPRVLCDGEFHFQDLYDAHRRFTGARFLAGSRPRVAAATRAVLDELVRQAMASVAIGRPDAEWIIDRTPREFEVLLQGAPHIYIVRDGRDVIVSETFHELRLDNPDRYPPEKRAWFRAHWEAFQRDPDHMTPENPGLLGDEEWVRHNAHRWGQRVREDLKHISETGQAAPVLVVRYEDLHADTEHWRARMYRHLGLDPREADPVSAESRTAPGFAREDRRSFYRKGAVGDWRNWASDDFRRWFKEEAGEALVELGYEASRDW